jgi:hypothetical protein
VTLQQVNGWQLDYANAEQLARCTDDLAYSFPQRADRPSIQTWDTASINNATTPLARKWTGDYSWIATVVPTTNAARDGMATNPAGFEYDISTVVFYKRVLPTRFPQSSLEAAGNAGAERAVKASIMSTGINGGEILLEHITNDGIILNTGDAVSTSPFDNLKVGNWVMLCGPHPNSTTSEPRFSLAWYQVLSIDGKGRRLNNQGTDTPPPGATEPDRRVITVRGPQWAWQPGGAFSNCLCVGIFRGAVAVRAKTLRLESAIGSSYGAGSAIVTPDPRTVGVQPH